MELTPMRFKTFTWPHNPQTYTITYTREMVHHKVPFGRYYLQNLGITRRIMKGVGEFTGETAYDTFKQLASLFYEDSPGVLVHPVWQTTNAWLVELNLEQEPRQDYVRYSFTFWECWNGYTTQPTSAADTDTASQETASWYTVVKGDCLWSIAQKYGTTVDQLLALNPQLKNANFIYPGDQLQVSG